MQLRPALYTKLLFLFLTFTFLAARASAQTHAQRSTLDIYLIDVEGGNAVLFVTPANESVLIDSGRDGVSASRIVAAAKDAGLTQIDHAITTHYDGDHYEGLAAVNAQVPIKDYIDHGPTTQPNPRAEQFLTETYPALYNKAKHTIVKAGDKIPLAGVDWRIVGAAENMIKVPVPGGGIPNPYCSSFAPPADAPFSTMEDPQSVASFIAFGKFRTVHLGDLTQKAEYELMCPKNPIGTVDVLLGMHHGQMSSNSIVAVHALAPSRRDHERRTDERRGTRGDENNSYLSRTRRPLGNALFGAQWTGIHRARNVYREFPGRSAAGHADRSKTGPAPRSEPASRPAA